MKTVRFFIVAWIFDIILMLIASYIRGYMAFGGENLVYILVVIYIYSKGNKNND